ncbi:uncharacterized protein LOC130138839 [Syzygium oleosum]|uniref:uncharacterized protein LOC130138839 n=1 Tax=Syzygium oleosum TaxID=219896 RepID=UPI0024BADED1|nr:uncharacterized protein LOC130138839 [Syzygium oleosum]
MMHSAVRSALAGNRTRPPSSALLRRAAPALRPLATEAARDMDKKGQAERDGAKAKTGPDAMAHSFGEGYATRSDEEGFGGIYEGSKSANNIQVDRDIHANHPAYDKTQGSEVKEKEKARHQTGASS